MGVRTKVAVLRFWRYVTAAVATVEPVLSETAQRRLRSPVVSIGDEILPVLVNALADVSEPLVWCSTTFTRSRARRSSRRSAISWTTSRAMSKSRSRRTPIAVCASGGCGRWEISRSSETRSCASPMTRRLSCSIASMASISRPQSSPRSRGARRWVAGLNLAALSLQREGDRERILERLPADDGFLVDYLWDEVVLSQPRTVRHFLMRTAILDRLTASLCDAVAERDDSDDMLRELERANLFVVPLEGSRRWFRYHRLFRDLVRSQLERYAPEVVPDLHRGASTWYAAHGFTVEAIDHAIAAGDVNYAAAELDRQWLDLYSAGQSATILDWIDRLPDDVLADYPTLALARAGIARAIGRLDEVEPWLQRAEAAAGDAPTVGFGTSVASGAALGRSMYRLALGDVDGAIAAGRQVVELERSRSPLEPTTANYFLGVVLFFDDPAEAEPLLHGFLERSSPGVDDVRRYFAQALLAEALEVARARQLAGR